MSPCYHSLHSIANQIPHACCSRRSAWILGCAPNSRKKRHAPRWCTVHMYVYVYVYVHVYVCMSVCMYGWVPREQPISVYWSVVVIDFIIKRHHVDGCYCVFKWPFSSYALCAICDNRKAKNHPSALWVTKAEMQCTQREKEMWKINCHCANLMKLLKKTLLSLETLLNMFDLFDSQYDIDRA